MPLILTNLMLVLVVSTFVAVGTIVPDRAIFQQLSPKTIEVKLALPATNFINRAERNLRALVSE